MITKQFMKMCLLYVNIINSEEILLAFAILRCGCINEVRFQNLVICKHSLTCREHNTA